MSHGEPAIDSSREKSFLSPVRLLLLSMGLYAVQTFWGFSMATLPVHLLEILGSETLTGIVIAAAGIFGMSMPIVAGALSDRISTPFGKRKPFIVSGWIVTVTILLIMPSVTSKAAVIFLALIVYAAFFVAMGPYFALLPDLAPPQQQGTASGVMFFVGGIGVIAYLFFGGRAWEANHAFPFFWAAGSIVFAVAVMCAGTREPKHPPVVRKSGDLIRRIMSERRAVSFYGGMILWWSGIWMANYFFVIAMRGMFGVTVREAVLVQFLFTVSYVLFALPMGYLGVRAGQKRLTVVGLMLLALVLFITGVVMDFRSVYPLMIIAGAAFAIILVVAYSYFITIIPPENTAGFLGVYMACQNGAILIGPALGGYLVETFGPRSMYPCAGVLVLLGVMCILNIRERRGGIPGVGSKPRESTATH
ncbi:MAG: MFS transporter [Deltaproteobacteria bacterium]|nr:MFS transporter [Candidatus Zymogenaceae bacterium]